MKTKRIRRDRGRDVPMKSTKNSELAGSANFNQFPRDCVQGLARKFADTFSSYLESPWEFWASSFLSCLGNVVAHCVTLHSSLSPQPRLYTILLGKSADDRKSECIKQTLALFAEAFPREFNCCHTVGSGEALIQQLERYPNTLLVYDEFEAFFEKARIPRSILFECANTLFEENKVQSHTKKDSIKVDSGYLSILGASTIDTFMNLWNRKSAEMGFLNRLWLVQAKADKKFPIPRPIPGKERSHLKNELIQLFNNLPSKRVKVLKITSKAEDIFNSWYENSKDSIFSRRLDTYGHRLMVLFCVNEGKPKVTPGIAKRVVKLLKWQKRIRKKCDPIDAIGLLGRLEESIRRRVSEGPVKKRDLERDLHKTRYPIHIWEKATRDLTKAGELTYDPGRKLYLKRKSF